MNDKNELNDIILDRNSSSSATKKLLLAIAALSLILIVVLVIMNSLNSADTETKTTISKATTESSAPSDEMDEPLFEPVEVIQEIAGEPSVLDDNLEQIAQKIKQESIQMQAEPIVSTTVVEQPIKTAPKEPEKKVITPTIKSEPKPVVAQPKPQPKPVAVAKTEQPKEAPKAVADTAIYYVQVGSFTKEPDKNLFERIGANGFKYKTAPAGEMTKVLIGPFEGRQRAQEALTTIKRNIEAGAFIIKG